MIGAMDQYFENGKNQDDDFQNLDDSVIHNQMFDMAQMSQIDDQDKLNQTF